MATLIYKRTHNGDPDPDLGVFGCHDCMGRVRGWIYNAVIGVGGIGQEPIHEGIAGRLTWIGIGPHRSGDLRKPTVTFDHFWYKGPQGPMLESVAPALARRMYVGRVRVIKDSALAPAELADVENILRRARRSPPSPGVGLGRQTASGKSERPCRPAPKAC